MIQLTTLADLSNLCQRENDIVNKASKPELSRSTDISLWYFLQQAAVFSLKRDWYGPNVVQSAKRPTLCVYSSKPLSHLHAPLQKKNPTPHLTMLLKLIMSSVVSYSNFLF